MQPPKSTPSSDPRAARATWSRHAGALREQRRSLERATPPDDAPKPTTKRTGHPQLIRRRHTTTTSKEEEDRESVATTTKMTKTDDRDDRDDALGRRRETASDREEDEEEPWVRASRVAQLSTVAQRTAWAQVVGEMRLFTTPEKKYNKTRFSRALREAQRSEELLLSDVATTYISLATFVESFCHAAPTKLVETKVANAKILESLTACERELRTATATISSIDEELKATRASIAAREAELQHLVAEQRAFRVAPWTATVLALFVQNRLRARLRDSVRKRATAALTLQTVLARPRLARDVLKDRKRERIEFDRRATRRALMLQRATRRWLARRRAREVLYARRRRARDEKRAAARLVNWARRVAVPVSFLASARITTDRTLDALDALWTTGVHVGLAAVENVLSAPGDDDAGNRRPSTAAGTTAAQGLPVSSLEEEEEEDGRVSPAPHCVCDSTPTKNKIEGDVAEKESSYPDEVEEDLARRFDAVLEQVAALDRADDPGLRAVVFADGPALF